MFYYVNGELALREAQAAVIDCGGVGYRLTVSLNTSESLSGLENKRVKLFTYLQVREDGVELYGFKEQAELNLFRLLIGVSGVGPKAAMAILSIMTPDRFAYAVCTEDIKGIAKAQGVGAKTAARVVLELKDKISKDVMTGATDTSMPTAVREAAGAAPSGKLAEATDALTVLGYSRSEILNVLRGIDTQNLTLEQIITAALKRFAG